MHHIRLVTVRPLFVFALLFVFVAACSALDSPSGDDGTTACGTGTITAIEDITPETSGPVTIEGVVVGNFEGDNSDDSAGTSSARFLRGFYVQDSGGDAMRSDGIFIFTGNTVVPTAAVGDFVRVTGTPGRFPDITGGQRQLVGFAETIICSRGNTLPEPAQIAFPLPDGRYLDRYVGMRVAFPQTLTVTELYLLGRHGELTLSLDRLYQPTQILDPGAGANSHHRQNDLRRIILDSPDTTQNPDPIPYPSPGLSATNTVRGGDTVTGLTGVLTRTRAREFSNPDNTVAYRLRPNDPADVTFVSANPRPESPPDVGGAVTVASFNVLNYFVTFGDACGPRGTMDCRGAGDDAEFGRQEAKIVSAICALNADVVGLIEVENPRTGTGDPALTRLVGALNAEPGCGPYEFVQTGTTGGDAIKNGLIYQPAAVTPVGDFAVLDDRAPFTVNTRPPLAQTFRANGGDLQFTAVVNHFKSKLCGGATGANRDQSDGQGCWNADRTTAALLLAEWLLDDPTGTGETNILIIGDLNAYAREDPLQVLEEVGYTDLAQAFSDDVTYSYVFDGQWGTLDYALASPSLLGLVTGAAAWHINADEPLVLEYTTAFKSDAQIDALYDAGPFRSSDHDPLLVGLRFP